MVKVSRSIPNLAMEIQITGAMPVPCHLGLDLNRFLSKVAALCNLNKVDSEQVIDLADALLIRSGLGRLIQIVPRGSYEPGIYTVDRDFSIRSKGFEENLLLPEEDEILTETEVYVVRQDDIDVEIKVSAILYFLYDIETSNPAAHELN